MSEKLQVARTSAIAGGTLALLKLAIGLLSGSLALLSEGIHSSLDFLVTLGTWFSVKTADIPADREHHYGHGKIENLSAFAQAVLLVVTGFWILIEAWHHLTSEKIEIDPGAGWYASIAVLVVSIGVDLSRSRALRHAARKFNSQALEADALHFGTELLSSAAVLAGLLAVKFGAFFLPQYKSQLLRADPLAAMFVAGVMLFTALRLGRRAADVLVDRAPEGVEDAVQSLIKSVAGVRDVSRVRARQSGSSTFVDATIAVDPNIGLAAGHEISDNVELRVTEKFPNLDILVHVEPARLPETHMRQIRATAEEMDIQLHAFRIRDFDGYLYINFHAEFPGAMTLAAAHQRVTDLEEKIRQRLPNVAEIESHLEPLGTD
jgi:cation diffusion facilitator family transporter